VLAHTPAQPVRRRRQLIREGDDIPNEQFSTADALQQARDPLDCHTAGGAQLRRPAPAAKRRVGSFSLGCLTLKPRPPSRGFLLPMPQMSAPPKRGRIGLVLHDLCKAGPPYPNLKIRNLSVRRVGRRRLIYPAIRPSCVPRISPKKPSLTLRHDPPPLLGGEIGPQRPGCRP
jgi:hypothetical protein